MLDMHPCSVTDHHRGLIKTGKYAKPLKYSRVGWGKKRRERERKKRVVICYSLFEM
jgi:hypothetical protein